MNKQQIIDLLSTNDKAICRALVVLTERQTADEVSSETTKYQNGRGWKSCHGHIGTSMAKFYERNHYLSPKQIAYWRHLNDKGQMRIACYAGQLLDIAAEKAARMAEQLGTKELEQV